MSLDEKYLEIEKNTLRLMADTGAGELAEALCFVPAMTALCCSVMNIRPQEPDWPDRDRLITASVPAAPCRAALEERGVLPEDIAAALPHGADACSLAVETAIRARADIKIYRTYLIISQADCLRGQLWESAIRASMNMLDDLTVILCRPAGEILSGADNICAKFSAFGFDTFSVDGSNPNAVALALLLPRRSHKPLFICCDVK